MQFVDKATIVVQGGDGGDGRINFRREKYVSHGGPDGGNGGNGGSVFLVGTSDLTSLLDYKYRNRFKAQDGRAGGGSERHGLGGKDLKLPIPLGTLIYNLSTQELIGEVIGQDAHLVAKGGQGGLGNSKFKSSVNRAPRQRTAGTPGEERKLGLELRLVVDVALIGLANSGKSSLLKALTHSVPKISDYPFTTQAPQLGIMRREVDAPSLMLVDMPGLIKDATQGKGLGTDFLKHGLRAQLLLHIVDLMAADILADITIIEQEMTGFSPELLKKPRWLVATRQDGLSEEELQAKQVQLRKLKRPFFMVTTTKEQPCAQLGAEILNFFIKERT